MKIEDGKLVIPVSSRDFQSIDQAMMLKQRSRICAVQFTDGELLAGICRKYLHSMGVQVKPSDGS